MKNNKQNKINNLNAFIRQQQRSLAFSLERIKRDQKDFIIAQNKLIKKIISDTKDIANAKEKLSKIK
jgi:hypothetical protein